MKIERLHIAAFVGVAFVSCWLAMHVQGTPVDWRFFLQAFGSVVAILGLFGALLEHVLWRQKLLHGWFVKRPDLRGTWRVELRSTWKDSAREEGSAIICYLGVEQTLSRLDIHLMTGESQSSSFGTSIELAEARSGYEVAAVYRNTPDTLLRDGQSEMHLGGLVLHTHGPANRPDTLTGEYWTTRETRGSMKLSDRVAEVKTRFEDAERAFEGESAAHGERTDGG